MEDYPTLEPWGAYPASLRKYIEKTVPKYAKEGIFLPLAAWALQGYDRDIIENHSKPCDIREDVILGSLVYRVPMTRREDGSEHGNDGNDGNDGTDREYVGDDGQRGRWGEYVGDQARDLQQEEEAAPSDERSNQ